MDENKEKKTGGSQPEKDDLQQEMEDLARIFKEELDKSKKEAEETLSIDDLEVEGYDPKKVSKTVAKTKETEMCEYCGKKPRGTDKNPKSPYCKDCEELLEKCPYDYKGVIVAIAIFCIVIGAVFCFAINTPIFSAMKKADKEVKEDKLYSAVVDYEKALELIQNKGTDDVFYNLHAKRIGVYYRLAIIAPIPAEVETYLGEKVLKLPTFKETKEIVDHVDSMVATSVIVSRHVDTSSVTESNFDSIIKELDGLIGKKVYIQNGSYYEDGDEGFVRDGKEREYTLDEGLLHLLKYQAAFDLNKDPKEYVEYMRKSVDTSDFMMNTLGYMLAGVYVEMEEFEKAEEIAGKLYDNNKESTDYFLISSMIKRYRDKDYKGALALADEGIAALTNSSGGPDMAIQYGHPLRMQRGLNYIMLGDYKTASDVIYECCYYLAQTPVDDYGTSMISVYPEAWEICALTALEIDDAETYDTMEENFKSEANAKKEEYEAILAEYKEGTKTLENIVESGRYDLI